MNGFVDVQGRKFDYSVSEKAQGMVRFVCEGARLDKLMYGVDSAEMVKKLPTLIHQEQVRQIREEIGRIFALLSVIFTTTVMLVMMICSRTEILDWIRKIKEKRGGLKHEYRDEDEIGDIINWELSDSEIVKLLKEKFKGSKIEPNISPIISILGKCADLRNDFAHARMVLDTKPQDNGAFFYRRIYENGQFINSKNFTKLCGAHDSLKPLIEDLDNICAYLNHIHLGRPLPIPNLKSAVLR